MGCDERRSLSGEDDYAGVWIVDEPSLCEMRTGPANPVIHHGLATREAPRTNVLVDIERIGDRLHELGKVMRLAIRQRAQHGTEHVVDRRHTGRPFVAITAALRSVAVVDMRLACAPGDETSEAFVPLEQRVVDPLGIGGEEARALGRDSPDSTAGAVGQTGLGEVRHRPVDPACHEADPLGADQLLPLSTLELELVRERLDDRAGGVVGADRRGAAAPGA